MSQAYTRDLSKFHEITPEEIEAIQALIELPVSSQHGLQNVLPDIIEGMEAATENLEKSIQKLVREDDGKDPTKFMRTLFVMQTEFVHMRNIITVGKKEFNPADQQYIANEWARISKDLKEYNEFLSSRYPNKRPPRREAFAGF